MKVATLGRGIGCPWTLFDGMQMDQSHLVKPKESRPCAEHARSGTGSTFRRARDRAEANGIAGAPEANSDPAGRITAARVVSSPSRRVCRSVTLTF